MNFEHFDQVTVVSFLENLYVGSVNDTKTKEGLRAAFGPDAHIFRRSFEQEKFTLDLLRIGYMYQVEDLQADCAEYLKETICDENVIEMMTVAHQGESSRGAF